MHDIIFYKEEDSMYTNIKNIGRILVITAIMSLLAVSYSIGESTEMVEKNHLDEGDLVKLGTYNGETIVWKYMGEDENGSYLISDKILTFKGFSPIAPTIDGSDKNSLAPGGLLDRSAWGDPRWIYSPLRVWLNSSEEMVDYESSNVNKPLKFYTVTYRDDNGFLKYVDNSYENESGFLNGFSSVEIDAIENVKHKTLIPSFDVSIAEGGDEESNQRIADYTTINNFKYEDYNSAYYVLSNEKIFLPSMEEIYKFFIEKDISLGAMPTQMAYDLDESKINNKILFKENHSYWLRTPKTKDILSGIETSVYTIYPYFINSDNPIDIFPEEPRLSVNEMVYKRNRNPYQRHAVGVRPACYLKNDLLYVQDGDNYWVPKIYTEKQ